MIAGQKMRGSNGLQNLLFPLPYMEMSQGEGGTGSHKGSYAMDFVGWGPNGRIYQAPYYAPCDLVLARVVDSVTALFWHSIEDVNFIDGTSGPCTVEVVHDYNWASFTVGEIRRQGELLGNTGNAGQSDGDHVHMEVARGHVTDWVSNGTGGYNVRNSTHIYNLMGINDTVLVVTGGYNWREFIQHIVDAKGDLIRLILTGANYFNKIK